MVSVSNTYVISSSVDHVNLMIGTHNLALLIPGMLDVVVYGITHGVTTQCLWQEIQTQSVKSALDVRATARTAEVTRVQRVWSLGPAPCLQFG